MDQSVSVEVKGLKCDTKDCNYEDMSIKVDDYEKYIDAPCPDCGASLLTQADYNTVQEIFEVTKVLNDLFPRDAFPDDEPEAKFELKMDGSGGVEVGDIELVEDGS